MYHLKIYLSFLLRNICLNAFSIFGICWAEGNYPVTGSKHPDFGGWSRFSPEQHANRQMTLSDLIVLMDIWPPGVLPMFKQVAPARVLYHGILLMFIQFGTGCVTGLNIK